MMKMFLLIMAVCGLTLFAARAESERDGNLWLKFRSDQKVLYLAGVFDGMGIAARTADEMRHSAEFSSLLNELMSPITTSQVAAGLDTFYKDYRNRSIGIRSACDVVIGLIRGADPVEVEAKVRRLRSSPR